MGRAHRLLTHNKVYLVSFRDFVSFLIAVLALHSKFSLIHGGYLCSKRLEKHLGSFLELYASHTSFHLKYSKASRAAVV